MSDAPARTFSAAHVSQQDSETIAALVKHIEDNPYAYETHVRLLNLLHAGLLAHIEASQPPHSYELLGDLRQAREAMTFKFSLGEDLLADWIRDESLLARTTEERIAVMELCHRALEDEPQSAVLWRLYGDWTHVLWAAAHDADPKPAHEWSSEDKMIGQEVFKWETMMQVWEEGIAATQWRLDDSNLVWDRWIEIVMEDQNRSPAAEKVRKLEAAYVERLLKPHATWDQTFQQFSTFISTYDNSAYEETMAVTNRRAAQAKQQFAHREPFELKIKAAVGNGDRDAERYAFLEYIDWEVRKQGVFSFHLINSLYERATLRFPTDASLWEDHVNALVENASAGFSALPVSKRAARHCPWSGSLWAKYLLSLEAEGKDFSVMEDVKHRATKTGLLDVGGMEELITVYVAWCGFLRRRAFSSGADEDELDVAEVGIRSALEHVKEIGEKRYGPEYKGDPMYRLERIYAKFLTQSGNHDGAREVWHSLIPHRGDGYDFWYRYYIYEMVLASVSLKAGGPNVIAQNNPPLLATAVLRQGLTRVLTMDWPESLIEMFLNHCEQHEGVQEIRMAEIEARKAMKQVSIRRQQESTQAAEAAAVTQSQEQDSSAAVAAVEGSVSGKRKRSAEATGDGGTISKKTKQDEVANPAQPDIASISANSQSTRDREHTSIVVENIPKEATELKVRQFFRDCGTINSIKLIPGRDKTSRTAVIEFDTKEDAQYAKSKEAKSFDDNAITISIGTRSTLWVTNFPSTADEKYLRNLFKRYGDIVEIRFPSLQFNTHRRFCYIQFLTAEQAQAATELDGQALEGGNQLQAKISDPSKKRDRTGAHYDGREVYVGNVDWAASEDEIRELFAEFGTIETLRVPRNMMGKTKGVAFITFSSKEEAEAAVDGVNLKPFRRRVLNVSISVPKGGKRHATTVINAGSPASTQDHPEPNGDGHKAGEPADQDYSSSTAATKRDRTIALLNVPDTVNDARIRALVEPHGALKKIILRPDHQGAIIEFENVPDVGRASLNLEGYEIIPGRRIRVGTVGEMLKQEAEIKEGRLGEAKARARKEKNATGAPAPHGGSSASKLSPFASAGLVHRPNQPGARRGGKGGLGSRGGSFGLGRSGPATAHAAQGEDEGQDRTSAEGGKKSNAAFKAMFLKGKGEEREDEMES